MMHMYCRLHCVLFYALMTAPPVPLYSRDVLEEKAILNV